MEPSIFKCISCNWNRNIFRSWWPKIELIHTLICWFDNWNGAIRTSYLQRAIRWWSPFMYPIFFFNFSSSGFNKSQPWPHGPWLIDHESWIGTRSNVLTVKTSLNRFSTSFLILFFSLCLLLGANQIIRRAIIIKMTAFKGIQADFY